MQAVRQDRADLRRGQQFCSGDMCPDLAHMAVQAVDARQVGNPPKQTIEAAKLPAAVQAKWAEMKQLAYARQLKGDELPTFGQANTNGSLRSFIDWNTVFVPVQLGGELLLGKVGPAGFGSHFGSDELFAAYKLVGNQLQPVAGFYLSVVARSFPAPKRPAPLNTGAFPCVPPIVRRPGKGEMRSMR